MWFLKYSKEAHKHACLSLYKALLTHAAHLPLSPGRQTAAAVIIRRKFRKSKNLQGGPRREALEAAHTDEALMRRACQGDVSAVASVRGRLAELAQAHSHAVAATFMPRKPVVVPPTPPSQLAPTRKRKVRELAMTPNEKAIRSARVRARPPTMGCTNGLPLLKRPGRRGPPPWVCAIINNKIKKGQKAVDQLQNLRENVLFYSEMEDAWDEAIAHLNNDGTRDDLSWSEAAEQALTSVHTAHHEKERKSYVLTLRFQKTIDQETVQYRVDMRNRRVQRRAQRKRRLIEQMETKLAQQLRAEWTSRRVPVSNIDEEEPSSLADSTSSADSGSISNRGTSWNGDGHTKHRRNPR